jgi:hypothetical protein
MKSKEYYQKKKSFWIMASKIKYFISRQVAHYIISIDKQDSLSDIRNNSGE